MEWFTIYKNLGCEDPNALQHYVTLTFHLVFGVEFGLHVRQLSSLSGSHHGYSARQLVGDDRQKI
jgi:hypothetical protein